jgi:hydrogenase nickel incorporation protein HypA/HybF
MDDLMAKILTTAEREGGGRVVAVRVRLGALSHFTPAHFREHFLDASRGTLAEGARVEAELSTVTTEAAAQSVVLEQIELELAPETSGG